MTSTQTQPQDRPRVIDENTSSRLRDCFGPVLCLFGLHNWGPPRAVNSLTLGGERQEDGTWEHWTEDPSKKVTQDCRSCSRYRDREDLDWQTLADYQAGDWNGE